jgi:hypothetical protein
MDGDGPDFYFKGFDDIPFDKAIYSTDHLLRVPGACKSGTSVGALAPVDSLESKLLVDHCNFNELFPPTDFGYNNWIAKSINSLVVEEFFEDNFVVTGWKPSLSFPRKASWYQNFRKFGVAEGTLTQTVHSKLFFGMTHTCNTMKSA